MEYGGPQEQSSVADQRGVFYLLTYKEGFPFLHKRLHLQLLEDYTS